MIPSLLQDFLVDEIKNIFKGFKLKNVNNEDVELNIYPQFLPARKGKKDIDHYPFIVVKLTDGEDSEENDPNMCRVLIFTGIYDKDDKYQGYKDSINIVQKIYEHLMKIRVFDNKYIVDYPVKWNLTEEDYYPYFYAGLETNWQVGKVTMRDDELT